MYITDPDNALSVIEWGREIQPSDFNSSVFEAFETYRAVHGGVSRPVLCFADYAGLIIFELDSESRILYRGDLTRLEAIRDLLHN